MTERVKLPDRIRG